MLYEMSFNKNTFSVNEPKRRTRGSNPRGPKPKVCDLCQIRKSKCDRAQPKCFFCQKFNKPCTYERDGYSFVFIQSNDPTKKTSKPKPKAEVERKCNETLITKSSSSVSIFKKMFIKSTAGNQSGCLVISSKGEFIYLSASMIAYYFTSNFRLLSSFTVPFKIESAPLVYNKNIPLEFSRPLYMQLIELYFGYVNSFLPALDPSSFYSQLESQNKSEAFFSLFNIVCLLGSSFYPDRNFGRIIAPKLAKIATESLKRIYQSPSITAIQACILACYHFRLCEKNTTITGPWIYLGIAKRMASQLGLTMHQNSLYKRNLYQRLWWIMFACEVGISESFGKPLDIIIDDEMTFPSISAILPSLTFSNFSVFVVKEITKLSSEQNAIFFHEACFHYQIMARRTLLRQEYGDSSSNKLSFDAILSDPTGISSKSPYFRKVKAIENASIDWFINLPGFLSPPRTKDCLFVPKNDIYLAFSSVYFYSSLIDFNKCFISKHDVPSSFIISYQDIHIDEFATFSPFKKCMIASFYGFKALENAGYHILEAGVPYFWYCSIQFIFMFLYINKNLPRDHWAVEPAWKNAQCLFAIFEKNSDRWAVIRESYFFLKPFMQKNTNKLLNP